MPANWKYLTFNDNNLSLELFIDSDMSKKVYWLSFKKIQILKLMNVSKDLK